MSQETIERNSGVKIYYMLFHSNKRDVLRVMSKVNGPSPNTEMGRNTKKF